MQLLVVAAIAHSAGDDNIGKSSLAQHTREEASKVCTMLSCPLFSHAEVNLSDRYPSGAHSFQMKHQALWNEMVDCYVHFLPHATFHLASGVCASSVTLGLAKDERGMLLE